MADIPNLKKKRLSEDGRQKRLEQWRKAFQALDENLKIVLYFEAEFGPLYRKLIRDKVALAPEYEVRILIINIPGELKIDYLAGCSFDRMFSDKGLEADVFYKYNPNDFCRPNSQKWEGFYEILWNYREKKIKGIPYIPRGVRRKTEKLKK
jgi:hypothetical protein